jgi:resuscitation-promoting factor RpfA
VANARRPIPPLRAYTATVLGVFALFVIGVGAGMLSWSIVVLGVALIILAVSLVVVSAMRGGARAYVAGTAHVVSASKPPASSVYGRCELHLIIEAPGVANAAVTIRDPRVPVAKWPDSGTTLPIMVAVDDPRRVRIQWDDVATHAEAAVDDQLTDEYGNDYSDEYPEYVPRSDPLDVPSEPTPPSDQAGSGPADYTGPAPADLADELLDPHDDRPGSAGGTATATAHMPPGPRRPEASPETPEEVYPVDGEPVFSPKVPATPEQADSVDPGAGAAGAPASGDAAEATQPRPRPRRFPDEQASAGERDAGTRGAVTTTVQDAEEGVESQSTPTVTAIEFDLGQLITAYPSARPGRAGEIHGVGITLLVRDLARSTEFYRDVLGFYEIDGGDGNVVLASGDTRVVLRADPDAPLVDHRLVHINLEVADVHAIYEELKAKGVPFTSGPRPTAVGERLEPWAATLRDPDGHGIAITQWRTRGASD